MKNFKELKEYLCKGHSRTMVVAAADEVSILKACRSAFEAEIVNLILIGNAEVIGEYFTSDEAQIIDIADPVAAAEKAVELLAEDEADSIMKGLVHSDQFLKAILSKKEELMEAKLLSHVAAAEFGERFIVFSDAGMNIKPDLGQKVEILKNAVKVAVKLGIDEPKTALICAVEKINTKMPCTLDAAIISKMAERGQLRIPGKVDGPLALDVALSPHAAKVKKLISYSGVPGNADVLIMNAITDGNAVYKTIEVFLNAPRAAVVAGSRKSIVLTSRGDDSQTKFNSIMLALAISS